MVKYIGGDSEHVAEVNSQLPPSEYQRNNANKPRWQPMATGIVLKPFAPNQRNTKAGKEPTCLSR